MPITIKNLGQISYDAALALMMTAHAERVQDKISDTIFVLEHTPVITRGRRMHDQTLPLEKQITAAGIEIRNADRGGLLTYHGPGQIVIYFVMRVSDYFGGPADMVSFVEKGLVDFFKTLGVATHIDPEHPGLWLGQKKIGSVGLRIAEGVSRHGIALNITSDLGVYKLFDPCGMSGDAMTNLQEVLGREILQDEFWNFAEKLTLLLRERFKGHRHNIPKGL